MKELIIGKKTLRKRLKLLKRYIKSLNKKFKKRKDIINCNYELIGSPIIYIYIFLLHIFNL